MSEEVIDLPDVLERVQDDKELLVELFDIYIGDFKDKRKSLSFFVADKNFDEVISIAHSLKGASGNISAKRLRPLFLRLEDMGKQQDLTGSDAILIELDKEFAHLEIRIEELKKEFSG